MRCDASRSETQHAVAGPILAGAQNAHAGERVPGNELGAAEEPVGGRQQRQFAFRALHPRRFGACAARFQGMYDYAFPVALY